MTGLLLILLLLAAAVGAAAFVAKEHWDLDSVTLVPQEVRGRFFALPGSGSARLRRRFVRSVTNERVVMPSGAVKTPRMMAIVVAEADLERLCPEGDVDDLAADAAKLYVAHARRRSWELSHPHGVRVFIESDPSRHPGWTPRTRIVSTPVPGAAGDSARPGGSRRSGPGPGEHLDGSRTVPDSERDGGQTTIFDPAAAANEPAGRWRWTDVDSGREVLLGAVPMSVGRSESCDIVVDAAGVSRDHLLLTPTAAGWSIRDSGSANGTWVDGRRLGVGETFVVPAHGQEVRLGNAGPRFKVEALPSVTGPG